MRFYKLQGRTRRVCYAARPAKSAISAQRRRALLSFMPIAFRQSGLVSSGLAALGLSSG